jgi:hypothetical protein
MRTCVAIVGVFALAFTHSATGFGETPHAKSCVDIGFVAPREKHLSARDRLDKLKAEAERQSAPNIVVDDIPQIALARQLAGAQRLVLLRRSASPVSELPFLEHEPKRMVVLHTVPTNSAKAVRLHGSSAQNIPQGYFDDLHQRLNRMPIESRNIATSAADDFTTRDALFSAVKEAKPDTLFLLLGHTTQGTVKFPDGSFVLLSELTDEPFRGKIWLVGCNTVKHFSPFGGGLVLGTGRRLSYSEGVQVISLLANEHRTRPATMRDLLLKLQNNPESMMTIGVLGTLIVVQPVSRDQQDSEDEQ